MCLLHVDEPLAMHGRMAIVCSRSKGTGHAALEAGLGLPAYPNRVSGVVHLQTDRTLNGDALCSCLARNMQNVEDGVAGSCEEHARAAGQHESTGPTLDGLQPATAAPTRSRCAISAAVVRCA